MTDTSALMLRVTPAFARTDRSLKGQTRGTGKAKEGRQSGRRPDYDQARLDEDDTPFNDFRQLLRYSELGVGKTCFHNPHACLVNTEGKKTDSKALNQFPDNRRR